MYVKREISNRINHLFTQYPVVTILGPRQSGKTMLAKNLFKDLTYVSLEDMDVREFAINDPRGFLDNYEDGVILDEIQRVPNLMPFLQTHVDSKNKPGQFIITGSNNFLIHEQISQSLAGRTAILKLLPFSYSEIKNTSYYLDNYEEYFMKGFYPRIYDKDLNPTTWYSNYVQTYIEKDLRQIKNISNLNTFQKFVKLCAGRIGQTLNLTSISIDLGISHNTVRDWLSILEMSFIIFLLQPFHRNFNKRLIKMPKLYFFDVGLAGYLLGVENKKQITSHYMKGALFENLIIAEIYKYFYNNAKEQHCYFWRDKTGHEIDCMIDSEKIIQIEIKSGKTVSNDFFENIQYMNNLTGKTEIQSYLIYGGDSGQKRNECTVLGWHSLQKIFK